MAQQTTTQRPKLPIFEPELPYSRRSDMKLTMELTFSLKSLSITRSDRFETHQHESQYSTSPPTTQMAILGSNSTRTAEVPHTHRLRAPSPNTPVTGLPAGASSRFLPDPYRCRTWEEPGDYLWEDKAKYEAECAALAANSCTGGNAYTPTCTQPQQVESTAATRTKSGFNAPLWTAEAHNTSQYFFPRTGCTCHQCSAAYTQAQRSEASPGVHRSDNRYASPRATEAQHTYKYPAPQTRCGCYQCKTTYLPKQWTDNPPISQPVGGTVAPVGAAVTLSTQRYSLPQTGCDSDKCKAWYTSTEQHMDPPSSQRADSIYTSTRTAGAEYIHTCLLSRTRCNCDKCSAADDQRQQTGNPPTSQQADGTSAPTVSPASQQSGDPPNPPTQSDRSTQAKTAQRRTANLKRRVPGSMKTSKTSVQVEDILFPPTASAGHKPKSSSNASGNSITPTTLANDRLA